MCTQPNWTRITRTTCTYKSISTTLARLPVSNDHGLIDFPELVKVLSETLVSGMVGQPPHEDLGQHGVLLADQRRVVGCRGGRHVSGDV